MDQDRKRTATAERPKITTEKTNYQASQKPTKANKEQQRTTKEPQFVFSPYPFVATQQGAVSRLLSEWAPPHEFESAHRAQWRKAMDQDRKRTATAERPKEYTRDPNRPKQARHPQPIHNHTASRTKQK